MTNLVARNNNFDAVRLGLALIVLFCHVGILTEIPDFQPFVAYLSSGFAVKGFFVLSGCLVTQSYLRSTSWRQYAEKRARRIYPAYFITIVLSALLGAWATTLPAYLATAATWRYLGANLTFLNFLQPTLPGVFESHAVPVVNASLWTIKVEISLYLCVPLLVFLFRKIGPYRTTLLALLVSLGWILLLPVVLPGHAGLAAELGRQFPGQLAYFCLGALFAADKRLPPQLGRITIATFLLFLLFRSNQVLSQVVEPVFYAGLVLFAATRLPVQLPAGRWGDLSYGTYLLHFPLIQFLISAGLFRLNCWLALVVTLFTVLTAALLMWHLVEKPLLKRSPAGLAARLP